MSTVASQITGVSIVYSTVCSGADQRNIKTPRHWPMWGELIGDRWIPLTKGQYNGKCLHLMTSSCRNTFATSLYSIIFLLKTWHVLQRCWHFDILRCCLSACFILAISVDLMGRQRKWRILTLYVLYNLRSIVYIIFVWSIYRKMTQIIHDDVIKWKHFPRYWPFVRRIHRLPVNSLSQRPMTRSFDVFFHLRLKKRLGKHS